MTTRQKLGLLLPLVPLAAIGIYEIVDTVRSPPEQPTICVLDVSEPASVARPEVEPQPALVLTPSPQPTVSF